jgi:hypothetical protein
MVVNMEGWHQALRMIQIGGISHAAVKKCVMNCGPKLKALNEKFMKRYTLSYGEYIVKMNVLHRNFRSRGDMSDKKFFWGIH